MGPYRDNPSRLQDGTLSPDAKGEQRKVCVLCKHVSNAAIPSIWLYGECSALRAHLCCPSLSSVLSKIQHDMSSAALTCSRAIESHYMARLYVTVLAYA